MFNRGEKRIVTLMVVATFSVVSFIMILWIVRIITEVPKEDTPAFATHLVRLEERVRSADREREIMTAEEFLRRFESSQFANGKEVVAVTGRLIERTSATGDPTHWGLTTMGREFAAVYFLADQVSAAAASSGEVITVVGVPAEFGGARGLHLARFD